MVNYGMHKVTTDFLVFPDVDLSIHQQQESHLWDTQLDGGGEQPM
jgi:hypothetical protein